LSVHLVAWGNAWLTGHVGLDEAADAMERPSGPGVITAIPGEPGEVPLRRGLAALRGAGLTALRLAKPAPGDPLGLAGPRELTVAAVAAGEAALAELDGRCMGLVPEDDHRGSSYEGVRWLGHAANAVNRAAAATLAEADHGLTLAMRAAAETLTGRGETEVRPELADALMSVRSAQRQGSPDGLAPGYPARAHRVAALAGRLSIVVDAALADATTYADDDVRRDTMRDLDRAVRRALVAACDSVFEPPR
jgi:hypothetical protein